MSGDNRGRELARRFRALDRLRQEARDAHADFQARIRDAERELRRLADDLATGQGSLLDRVPSATGHEPTNADDWAELDEPAATISCMWCAPDGTRPDIAPDATKGAEPDERKACPGKPSYGSTCHGFANRCNCQTCLIVDDLDNVDKLTTAPQVEKKSNRRRKKGGNP